MEGPWGLNRILGVQEGPEGWGVRVVFQKVWGGFWGILGG